MSTASESSTSSESVSYDSKADNNSIENLYPEKRFMKEVPQILLALL